MAKQIPIGDIVRKANISGLTQGIAGDILRQNEAYREKIKETVFNGTVIDGDLDELVAYVTEHYEPIEEKPTNIKLALEYDISAMKEALPTGSEYYEYKTIIIQDSEFLGKTDAEMIELTLNKYALEGWRLKEAITNEMGHNRAVVVNATINNTILILERLATKE